MWKSKTSIHTENKINYNCQVLKECLYSQGIVKKRTLHMKQHKLSLIRTLYATVADMCWLATCICNRSRVNALQSLTASNTHVQTHTVSTSPTGYPTWDTLTCWLLTSKLFAVYQTEKIKIDYLTKQYFTFTRTCLLVSSNARQRLGILNEKKKKK